jgi:glycerol uptake facilitator-like aquaporin
MVLLNQHHSMAASVPIQKTCLAEAFGTFWLVLGGCGSAAIAATSTPL